MTSRLLIPTFLSLLSRMGNMTGITVTDSASVPYSWIEIYSLGDAAKFLDFHVLATVTVACERGRLYHPLKLCKCHYSGGISSRYFTANI
jgi:hypothetical protein